MYTVYKLTNQKNRSQTYIGTTGNVEKRMELHQSRARGGFGSNLPISKAISRVGFNNFKLTLLAEFRSQHQARAHERELIDTLEPTLNVNA